MDFEVLKFSDNIKEIHGGIVSNKNETFKYTVIPQSVVYVGAKAFNKGEIFCEHKSKPLAWDNFFVYGTAKVYWQGEWEYDENGIPKAIDDIEEALDDGSSII